LYGWKAWSLTLREEHRLRVFEIKVLRGIFGHKRGSNWRKISYLTLREQHGVRMFENEVPRRTFCPKREEVTGG
jgi:hypothetical protein